MRALQQARERIENAPESLAAHARSCLVELHSLDQLDHDDFELALDLIRQWRRGRHHSAQLRLLDLSVPVGEPRQDALPQASPAPVAAEV